MENISSSKFEPTCFILQLHVLVYIGGLNALGIFYQTTFGRCRCRSTKVVAARLQL